MLKINQFYWQLYKESPEGKITIAKFERVAKASFSIDESVTLLKEYNPVWFLNVNEDETKYDYFLPCARRLGEWSFDKTKTPRENAEEMISQRYYGNYKNALCDIIYISFYLYKKDPSYFIPYLFVMNYHYLWQILVDYELDLEEIPGKADFEKRCLFYFDICDALMKFREFNDLTEAELCAFLYDMERKKYDATYSKGSTPYPQVWLIGGGKDEDEAKKETICWQASADTKEGDILIMYETGDTWPEENKSCLTGIWRAKTDGINDPLFFRYGSVIIGEELKVKPIPFKELLKNEKTNKLPRCGAHFCGVKGDYVSYECFDNLLSFIKEWDPSFDRTQLPVLHEPNCCVETYSEAKKKDKNLKPEKWVEEYYIVPMLDMMGWKYKKDYDRQVHLQMGRAKVENEKRQDGRPDFSLFFFGHKDKCADVVIEAKGPREMDGDRDLEVAFWQAESYASRQYAGLIILADNQRVVLFPRNKEGIFKYIVDKENNEYKWDAIFNNPDKRNELRKRILSYKKQHR